jgi:predicted transcriptional regulator
MSTIAAQKTQKSRKVTLNLPQATIEKLVSLAERLNLTQTQVIRESIEIRHLLQQEIDDGGTVLIERSDGEAVKIWLPGSS